MKENSRLLSSHIEHRAAWDRDTVSLPPSFQLGFLLYATLGLLLQIYWIYSLVGWLVGFPCEKPTEPLKEFNLGEFRAQFSIPHPPGTPLLNWTPLWEEAGRGCYLEPQHFPINRHLTAAAGAGSGSGWWGGTTQACQDIKLEEMQMAI